MVRLVIVEVALFTNIPPDRVASPVTFSVEESVVAPATANVPLIVVLPNVAPPT